MVYGSSALAHICCWMDIKSRGWPLWCARRLLDFDNQFSDSRPVQTVRKKDRLFKMSDVSLIPRRLGKIELQSKLAQLLVEVIKDVTPNNMLFQSCIVCEHFGENEICSRYNVRPPARIIVFGCQFFEESSHVDGDIPF